MFLAVHIFDHGLISHLGIHMCPRLEGVFLCCILLFIFIFIYYYIIYNLIYCVYDFLLDGSITMCL